jgi:hypothetical protein
MQVLPADVAPLECVKIAISVSCNHSLTKISVTSGHHGHVNFAVCNLIILSTSCSAYESSFSLWGLASYDAYRAYGDASMLKLAQDIWNVIVQLQISESEAQSGTHPRMPFKFVSQCSGSMYFGVGSPTTHS